MLSIKNLSAVIDGKPILKGLSLEVPAGQVHAIMGPNGAGKSTLSYVLTGRDGYEVTGGAATLDGEDLLALNPAERAARGVFLSFQYPVEIPGVPALTFLRTALNAQRKARAAPEVSAPDFLRLVNAKADELRIDRQMLRRALNVGFSGGEKKRMEILQMAVLAPRFAILDETDSGLDIDALRIVAEGVNAMRAPDRSMLVITHYQRLLDHIRPDRVHVLAGGRIVASGGPELAHELEREGYEVTGGDVTLNGEDLLALSPAERAAKGVFLSFQYPIEIPGVPALTFLRTALNAQKKARGEAEVSAPEFLKLIRQKSAELKIDFDMLRRALNVGFSGGEKKRMEILQMAVLAPKLAILDETDSGLDIDALRIVADGVNAMRAADRSMLVITHYQRLLDHIRPDRVHVLAAGRIVASGGPELAHQLEREGYDKYAPKLETAPA
jgi:Fe-S cluster assembly ATP-binding protein